MNLKSQKGSMILGVALFMAVLAGVTYFYSNVQMVKVTAQYRRTQSMAYAHQIAGNLAQNLRWAYDAAKAGACGSAQVGGVIVTVPGSAINLCLEGGQTCTPHPANPNRDKVCISLTNNTLFAKANVLPPQPQSLQRAPHYFVRLLSSQAFAQGYSPAPPLAADTSNSLPSPPQCVGDTCNVTCGPDADCITFKFCPISGSTCDPARPDDWVSQTVAFLK